MAISPLALCTTANKAQTMPQRHCSYVSNYNTTDKTGEWTYSHSWNVPPGTELLEDDIRGRFENDVSYEEDGQGQIVLIVRKFQIISQP